MTSKAVAGYRQHNSEVHIEKLNLSELGCLYFRNRPLTSHIDCVLELEGFFMCVVIVQLVIGAGASVFLCNPTNSCVFHQALKKAVCVCVCVVSDIFTELEAGPPGAHCPVLTHPLVLIQK